jgi:hypothetical protein
MKLYKKIIVFLKNHANNVLFYNFTWNFNEHSSNLKSNDRRKSYAVGWSVVDLCQVNLTNKQGTSPQPTMLALKTCRFTSTTCQAELMIAVSIILTIVKVYFLNLNYSKKAST